MTSFFPHQQIQPSDHTILLVEDAAVNAAIMMRLLKHTGYQVVWKQTGEAAWEHALTQPPDLILLDVVLPGMDGFTLCRRLKKTAVVAEIPIIFMTSMSETDAKLEGFAIGAVDYVIKPINAAEFLARIRTHLTLHILQKKLEQEIAEREKLITDLDAFSHTVAHDLKSPLQSIGGYAEMLLKRSNDLDREKIGKIAENLAAGSAKMTSIIENLLLLARVRLSEEIIMSRLDMRSILNGVLDRLAPMAEEYNAQIELPKTYPAAMGHAPWVEQIWVNYISNGIKYGGTPPVLNIGASPTSRGAVKFWVTDNGAGVSPDQTERLFQPFQRLSRDVNIQGHGLGLSIVQRIAERLDGSVGVESTPGEGSCFYFTLPAADVKTAPAAFPLSISREQMPA